MTVPIDTTTPVQTPRHTPHDVGVNPVAAARLRTALSEVTEQTTALRRHLVGLLPVPAVLLAGALALALAHPGLLARILLDTAVLPAATAVTALLIALAPQRADLSTGPARWAMFAPAPAGLVNDITRTGLAHPQTYAGQVAQASRSLITRHRLLGVALLGTAASTGLVSIAVLLA